MGIGENDRKIKPQRLLAVAVAVALAFGGAGAFLITRGSDSRNVASPDAEPEPLIDPNEIISGGPPPDGIPPIDEPKFVEPSAVDWLAPQEPVVSVEIEGDAVAYPLQIMTWHEIVNDEIGGVPVSVTFCPLCNTAYAFERPTVDGEVTTFGTSGKLYHSNLVMYDRATESYWPQVMGQAAVGPLTGTKLERIPAQIVSWREFRSAFPEGKVLSRDTGHARKYGENPYVGYDDVDNPPFLFRGETDGRLAPVERIIGVESEDDVVAFPYFRLEEAASGGVAAVNAKVGDDPVVVLWKEGTASALDESEIAASRDVGAAAAFSPRVDDRILTLTAEDGRILDEETRSSWNLFGKATDGELEGEQLESIDAADSFWFDWAAFHPNTSIWGTD